MPEPDLDPALTALAGALGRLTPAPPALDRDRLFFDAGRRAVRPRGWQLATGLCAAVAVALGVRLATIPDPVRGPETVRIVYLPAPAAAGPESPATPPADTARVAARPLPAGGEYLRRRDELLRWDVLPAAGTIAPSIEDPIELLLGLPRGSLTDPNTNRLKTSIPRGDV